MLASPAAVGDDLHNARLGELGRVRRLRCVELARNRADLLVRCALASALFESISYLHLDAILFSLRFSLEPPPVVELDGEIRDGQEQRHRCACDEECIAEGGGRWSA